jgi:hypothetical protein
MTPKEKAKELVKRYTDFNSSTLQIMSGKYSTGIAKQCVLIAVDEMIEETLTYPSLRKIYWERVKKEIEQL